MTPVLQRIAGALVGVLPESWSNATMRVEVRHHPTGELGMPHSIWSDDHPRVAVSPSDDVYEATYDLYQTCAQSGQPWSAMVFRVERVGEGWKFGADFEHSS